MSSGNADSAPEEVEAHYGSFYSELDCDGCGDVIRVEGDVSNGEKVYCEVCDAERVVVGR